MADFKKTIAKAKVADAETKAFMARLQVLEAILQGATPHDVATLCAHALAAAAPLCCEAHQDEFKAEFLRVLDIASQSSSKSKTRPRLTGRRRAHVGALREPTI